MRTPKRLLQFFKSADAHEDARRYKCSPCIWAYPVPEQGKVNVYICQNGHQTWTTHADDGVTPFIIGCAYCGADAHSSFYSCDQNPPLIHGVWSKEPNRWWGDESAQRDHAEAGGVFLYAVPLPNRKPPPIG